MIAWNDAFRSYGIYGIGIITLFGQRMGLDRGSHGHWTDLLVDLQERSPNTLLKCLCVILVRDLRWGICRLKSRGSGTVRICRKEEPEFTQHSAVFEIHDKLAGRLN